MYTINIIHHSGNVYNYDIFIDVSHCSNIYNNYVVKMQIQALWGEVNFISVVLN